VSPIEQLVKILQLTHRRPSVRSIPNLNRSHIVICTSARNLSFANPDNRFAAVVSALTMDTSDSAQPSGESRALSHPCND
jgi:hypothetical protein